MRERTRQLTEFTCPLDKMHTQYGYVDYATWCRLELERINRKDKKVHIVKQAGGFIALSR